MTPLKLQRAETHCESRILRQLEIRQQILDLHSLEELVSSDYPVRDTILLESRLNDARKGIIPH